MSEELIVTWIHTYGYPLLFLLLLAGVIGFPIPDEGVLLAAGALIAKGVMSGLPSFCCSVFAVLLGSMINYHIALTGKRKLLRFGKKWGFSIKRWKRSILFVHKYGVWSIPFSYFIPGVRMGVSYSAGVLHIGFRDYVLFSFIGSLIWVGIYLFLGYLMGK